VSLAELDAGERCRQGCLGFDRGCGCDEAVAAQQLGEHLGAGRDVRTGLLDNRSVAAFHFSEALDGELPHRFGSGHLAEPLQCNGGDVEIVVSESGLAL
jgi:hypothetical protein